MKTLGEKVKELRISKELTQEALTKELGYTNKSTITKIESDVNNLSYEMMKKIASYFDVNVSYLFDDENDPFPYSVSTTDNNGKRKVYHLSEKQFEEIMLQLDTMKQENN